MTDRTSKNDLDLMRNGLLKAYELLAYGQPDQELHNATGASKWVDECDKWLDMFAPSKVAAFSVETSGNCGPNTPWDCLCGEPSCSYCGLKKAEPDTGVALQMRLALRKIAYEPFGEPEATDRAVLDAITQLAKETLALTDGPLPVFEDMETAAHAFFNTGQHRIAGADHVQAVQQFAKWVDAGAPGYLRRAVKSEARRCPKCGAADAAECRCSPDDQWASSSAPAVPPPLASQESPSSSDFAAGAGLSISKVPT